MSDYLGIAGSLRIKLVGQTQFLVPPARYIWATAPNLKHLYAVLYTERTFTILFSVFLRQCDRVFLLKGARPLYVQFGTGPHRHAWSID